MRYDKDLLELDGGPEWSETSLEGIRTMTAAEFLSRTGGADDDAVEELFEDLALRRIALDISDLPRLGASGQAALRLREEMELVQRGDLLTGLDKNDPLRLYLEEVAATPAAGDADLLAAELAEANRNGTDAGGLCARLVDLSLGRVVETAKEYTGYGVLLLDLIQEGNLGMWNVFTEHEGGDICAELDWWIRQSMIRAILRQVRSSGLGQKIRQAVEDYRMVDERLLTELGRNPTIEELAEGLHMTVEETENVRKALENARMVGKAHEQPEPQEETPEDSQAVEDTSYYQTRERVEELMSGLSEREMQVLNLRFGLSGKAPMTAAEAGRKLNMTVSEVVAVETAALEKMRRPGE